MKRKIISGLLTVFMICGAAGFAGCDEMIEDGSSTSSPVQQENEIAAPEIPTLEQLLDDESFKVKVGDRKGYDPIEDPSWEKLLASTKPLEMNESYTEDWSRPLEETRLRPYLRFFDMPEERPQATYEFVEVEGGKKAVKINCNGAPGGAQDYVNFRGMRFTAGAQYTVSVTYTTLTAGANYYLGFDHYGVRIAAMPAVELNKSNTVTGEFLVSELYSNNSISSLTVVADNVEAPSSVRIDSITIKRRPELVPLAGVESLKKPGDSVVENFDNYIGLDGSKSVLGSFHSNCFDFGQPERAQIVEDPDGGNYALLNDYGLGWNVNMHFLNTKGKFLPGSYTITISVIVEQAEAGAKLGIGLLNGGAWQGQELALTEGTEIVELAPVPVTIEQGDKTSYLLLGCLRAKIRIESIKIARFYGDNVVEDFSGFNGLDGSKSVLGSFHSNCFDFGQPERAQIVEDPDGGNYALLNDYGLGWNVNMHFLNTKGKFLPGSYTITISVIVEQAEAGAKLGIGLLNGGAWQGQELALTEGTEIVELAPVPVTIEQGDKTSYLLLGCLRAKIRIESIKITKV